MQKTEIKLFRQYAENQIYFKFFLYKAVIDKMQYPQVLFW